MSRFSLRSIQSPLTSLANTARSISRGVRKSTSSTHALWRSAANLRRVVRRLVSRSAASRSTSSPTRSSNGRASRSGDRRCSSKALAIPVKPSVISRSWVGCVSNWSLPGSVEIALTADVAVAQGLVVGRLVEESAIEAALEDRTDRGDGASLDQDGASAGGIDARIVVAPGQRQETEAGAEALLGMR